MASDPWDTMYVSDSDGYWHNTINVSTFTVEDAFPVAYRTLVVHMSASANATRIGCGVIGVPDTAVSEVGAYPGYSGALSVRATVAVQNNDYNTVLTDQLGKNREVQAQRAESSAE
jgi:hypothetical protein